jgi:hypothetical protein
MQVIGRARCALTIIMLNLEARHLPGDDAAVLKAATGCLDKRGSAHPEAQPLKKSVLIRNVELQMANISRDLIGWIRLTENLLVCLPAPMAMTDRRPEIFVGRSPDQLDTLDGKSRTYE